MLVAQRSGGPYDGLWEFPGGKVEPGETDLTALVRECAEELGVAIAPSDWWGGGWTAAPDSSPTTSSPRAVPSP